LSSIWTQKNKVLVHTSGTESKEKKGFYQKFTIWRNVYEVRLQLKGRIYNLATASQKDKRKKKKNIFYFMLKGGV
jgi:hypothetical protein